MTSSVPLTIEDVVEGCCVLGESGSPEPDLLPGGVCDTASGVAVEGAEFDGEHARQERCSSGEVQLFGSGHRNSCAGGPSAVANRLALFACGVAVVHEGARVSDFAFGTHGVGCRGKRQVAAGLLLDEIEDLAGGAAQLWWAGAGGVVLVHWCQLRKTSSSVSAP